VAERRRVRLGVATIQPTEKQYREENNFGKYFIEKLITVLKKQKSKIRLFERNRMEEVLREYSLNQSGPIIEKEAIEIGGIAPIDYVITGTYTRLKTKVDINIRMLDVVSGEIVATFSEGVELNEELRSLFPGQEEHCRRYYPGLVNLSLYCGFPFSYSPV
jgi:TolB-like protein